MDYGGKYEWIISLKKIYLPFGLMILVACTGPQTTRPSTASVGSIGQYLDNGTSTKESIRKYFGEPSRQFEDGRLWTYRIYQDRKGYRISRSSSWGSANRSLILVFSSTEQLLIDWKLVEVKK